MINKPSFWRFKIDPPVFTSIDDKGNINIEKDTL